MEMDRKESYTEPVLVAHDLLRDITGTTSAVKTRLEKPGFPE